MSLPIATAVISRNAELLGDNRGAKLVQTTLDEEVATDQKLTALAKSTINIAAE
jgi:ferritin-like metal-binding protein YciE